MFSAERRDASTKKPENLQKKALDLDALEMVTGGRSENNSPYGDGIVIEALPDQKYIVNVDGQLLTVTKLPGGKVQVEAESKATFR